MRVIALALFAALSGCPAAGPMIAAPRCIALERLVDTAPPGFVLKPISGKDHVRAVILRNALLSQKDEFGLVVWGEGPQGVIIFYGNLGEICHYLKIDPNEVEQFRLAIFGPSA